MLPDTMNGRGEGSNLSQGLVFPSPQKPFRDPGTLLPPRGRCWHLPSPSIRSLVPGRQINGKNSSREKQMHKQIQDTVSWNQYIQYVADVFLLLLTMPPRASSVPPLSDLLLLADTSQLMPQ